MSNSVRMVSSLTTSGSIRTSWPLCWPNSAQVEQIRILSWMQMISSLRLCSWQNSSGSTCPPPAALAGSGSTKDDARFCSSYACACCLSCSFFLASSSAWAICLWRSAISSCSPFFLACSSYSFLWRSRVRSASLIRAKFLGKSSADAFLAHSTLTTNFNPQSVNKLKSTCVIRRISNLLVFWALKGLVGWFLELDI